MNFLAKSTYRLFEEDSFSAEFQKEFPSRQKVHNDKKFLPRLKRAVHCHDERRAHPGQDLSFSLYILNISRFTTYEAL